jgi:drug/metabolite transporter (DMT)-like permease
LLQKKFFWGDAFFGAIILVGLIIIVSLENSLFWGIFYGVLGAFTGAFFGTYNGKLIQKHNSLYITLIEFIGAIILITVAKFFFSSNSFHIISLNSQDLFYLLVLSIFCTTLAFTLSVEIMKHFTPFTVIITNNLEPIYGVFFSVLLFKETELMSSKFYMGAVIILLTVFSYPFFNRKYNKNN